MSAQIRRERNDYYAILDLVERGPLRKDPGRGRSTSYSLAIDS